ncbi:MAG: GtrA family protein [Lachnospiraceae bacterium]|nr:GtrA family protein [Lachnospiraceae bacterium]
MKKSIMDFIDKYHWLALYGLFGIGTLLTNIYSYAFCARFLNLSTAKSNVVAWTLSLIFSYITNRKWVFESNKSGLWEICKECVSFVSCRIMTGAIDIFLMVVLVDGLHFYDMNVKILTNFIVIIVNLVTCKNIIFKDNIEDKVEEVELADEYVN